MPALPVANVHLGSEALPDRRAARNKPTLRARGVPATRNGRPPLVDNP